MRYKIRYVDPSKTKDSQPNSVVFTVGVEISSLRKMFEKACAEGKFPSGLVERGLDMQVPVVIHCTDADGKNSEQTSLSSDDIDANLLEFFEVFVKITLIEFQLKKQEAVTSNVSSFSKKAGVFNIFLTPDQRVQELIESSKRRKKEDTCTPKTRQEFKLALQSDTPTPNMDTAYDQVLSWLIGHLDFKCSQRVRDSTDHVIYVFIEHMSLLILQVISFVNFPFPLISLHTKQ